MHMSREQLDCAKAVMPVLQPQHSERALSHHRSNQKAAGERVNLVLLEVKSLFISRVAPFILAE